MTSPKKDHPTILKDLHANALNLLARREHSADELKQKLQRQGFDLDAIATEIHALQEKGWQSDQRFAECFIRYRQQQGKGPIRIKQELKQRGIADKIIQSLINEHDEIWLTLAKQVRDKKYRSKDLKDMKLRAKAYRYLQYTGYTFDQIKLVLNEEIEIDPFE